MRAILFPAGVDDANQKQRKQNAAKPNQRNQKNCEFVELNGVKMVIFVEITQGREGKGDDRRTMYSLFKLY